VAAFIGIVPRSGQLVELVELSLDWTTEGGCPYVIIGVVLIL
jgi:hypothetical protein